jgi:hypothetical protein
LKTDNRVVSFHVSADSYARFMVAIECLWVSPRVLARPVPRVVGTISAGDTAFRCERRGTRSIGLCCSPFQWRHERVTDVAGSRSEAPAALCWSWRERRLDEGDEPFESLLVSADGVGLDEDHNRVAAGDRTQHPEFALVRWAAAHLTPADRTPATVYTSGGTAPCARQHTAGSVCSHRIRSVVGTVGNLARRAGCGGAPRAHAADWRDRARFHSQRTGRGAGRRSPYAPTTFLQVA